MPRPRRRRYVGFQPGITYFKPAGVRMVELEEIILTFDESEALRLKDFLGLDQKDAAEKMNISQPTFHRLVLTARRKVADAIVNGKAIRIKGGNFKMMQQPMQPRTGRGAGAGMGRGQGRGAGMGRGMGFGGPAISCVCTKCSYEEPKARGVPCAEKRCPKCGAQMVRG